MTDSPHPHPQALEEATASAISETVSEKPMRGRPRRYHPDHIAFVRDGTNGLTTRAAQNKIHASRALGILEPASERHPELLWLLNRADGTLRWTTLAELGRVRHDEAMIFLAREVAREHIKSREAVAYIRRERRVLEEQPLPPASARALARALLAALDDYERRHPDLTPTQVRDALNLVAIVLRREDRRVG